MEFRKMAMTTLYARQEKRHRWAGEYRFRLYATNGLCICHSAHGYSTKSGCKGGIESIGRFASEAAKIDKSYLK